MIVHYIYTALYSLQNAFMYIFFNLIFSLQLLCEVVREGTHIFILQIKKLRLTYSQERDQKGKQFTHSIWAPHHAVTSWVTYEKTKLNYNAIFHALKLPVPKIRPPPIYSPPPTCLLLFWLQTNQPGPGGHLSPLPMRKGNKRMSSTTCPHVWESVFSASLHDPLCPHNSPAKEGLRCPSCRQGGYEGASYTACPPHRAVRGRSEAAHPQPSFPFFPLGQGLISSRTKTQTQVIWFGILG